MSFAPALLTGALAVLPAAMALAQATPPSGVVEQDATVDRLGHELRCPVCQGMPIAESPSDMAQAMMQRVRELRTEGKSPEEIKQYFVQRYGQWVLLEPEAEGFNLLVWVLPPIALALGIGAIALYARKTRKGNETAAPGREPTDDPYLKRVRESLEKGEM